MRQEALRICTFSGESAENLLRRSSHRASELEVVGRIHAEEELAPVADPLDFGDWNHVYARELPQEIPRRSTTPVEKRAEPLTNPRCIEGAEWLEAVR